MTNTFALLKNNVIDNIILLEDKDSFSESEGIDFCKSIMNGDWIGVNGEYSYRGTAGIGYTYDPDTDTFIAQTE